MIVNLSGEVEYEMFNTLIKAYNLSSDDLHIYFSSPEGGSTDVAEAIIDFINSHKEKIRITFYGENHSSGMVIFLKTSCKKSILPDTRGMFHFAYQQLDISEGGKPSSEYGRFSIKEMKDAKANTIEYLKSISFTVKEINGIKQGKEVYFSHSRMSELLNAI